MRNPFLVGKKIYLRIIEESDLNENYQSWFNDEEVCKFNSHHRFPNYRQDMEEYYNDAIKSKNNIILAIMDKETDKHIGDVSLQDIDLINGSAEFAIIIGDKDCWDKGVGKESARLIISHGFGQLNLTRIYCGTSEKNIGMQKLAESIGFKKEGAARKAIYKNGEHHNIINFGLLKEEYEEQE